MDSEFNRKEAEVATESDSTERLVPEEESSLDDAPQWWCAKGSKMGLMSLDMENRSVRIANSTVAMLTINRVTGYHPEEWHISWQVLHRSRGTGGIHDEVAGNLLVSSKELRRMFGHLSRTELVSERAACFRELIGECYIRSSDYLNIPGGMTGHAAPAGISIHLKENIKYAIKQLLTL